MGWFSNIKSRFLKSLNRFKLYFWHGKLYRKTVYLIGPIDRCPDRGQSWRAILEPYLTDKYGINVYNPLNKPINLGLETPDCIERRKRLKRSGSFDEFAAEIKQIRVVDLRMCDKADFAICYIDTDIHMCGTYEELTWLNRSKKPVLVCCKQGKAGIPDWLFGTLPHELFFDTWDDLLQYVGDVDSGKDTRTFNRWMFFDR